MFEINYSQLIQYEILDKLVTYMSPIYHIKWVPMRHLPFTLNPVFVLKNHEKAGLLRTSLGPIFACYHDIVLLDFSELLSELLVWDLLRTCPGPP